MSIELRIIRNRHSPLCLREPLTEQCCHHTWFMLHYTCTQPGRREDRKVAATTEPSQVICSMHLNYAFLEKKTSLVGWFDSVVFENWFFKTAVPYFNGLHTDERRIIIGDNVASHLSYRVIQYCITNNIRFAFLPPNATHLCQPLDVAYFRPLKRAWSNTLSDWKKHNNGSVPKHVFQKLLKKALLSIDGNSTQNMRSGFKASGIYPLNKNAVLSKLPDDVKQKDTTANTSFSEQLVIMLKEERFGKSEERAIPRKRRLIDVEPGASVTEEQAHQLLVKNTKIKEDPDVEDKNTGGGVKPTTATLKKSSTRVVKKTLRPFKDRSNQEGNDAPLRKCNERVVVKQEPASTPIKIVKSKRIMNRNKTLGSKKLRL